MFPRPDKGILTGVLGLGRLAELRHGDEIAGAKVTPQEQLEGIGISVPRPAHK